MAFKSGFVAVIGKPNVGKSSLVNKLVGEKVSVVMTVVDYENSFEIYLDGELLYTCTDTATLAQLALWQNWRVQSFLSWPVWQREITQWIIE